MNHLVWKRKQVQGTSRYFVLTIGVYISVCISVYVHHLLYQRWILNGDNERTLCHESNNTEINVCIHNEVLKSWRNVFPPPLPTPPPPVPAPLHALMHMDTQNTPFLHIAYPSGNVKGEGQGPAKNNAARCVFRESPVVGCRFEHDSLRTSSSSLTWQR